MEEWDASLRPGSKATLLWKARAAAVVWLGIVRLAGLRLVFFKPAREPATRATLFQDARIGRWVRRRRAKPC
jgi:hypothetical protein